MLNRLKPTANCRVLTDHFLTPEWYRTLEREALYHFDSKTLYVREYLADTWISKIECRVRPLSAHEKNLEERQHFHDGFRVIEFRATELDEKNIRKTDFSEIEDVNIESLIEFGLHAQLADFCERYLFLISLTSWGAFEPSVVEPGQIASPSDNHSFVGLRRDKACEEFMTGPLSKKIEADAFLNWTKKCDGFWDGIATTNIQKALSFLSNALSAEESSSSVSRLFWSIAGLEAIAADSNLSVRKNLKDRIPKVANILPLENYGKVLGKIYDLRSRILHGDVPIRSRFDELRYDDENNFELGADIFGVISSLILTAIIIQSALSDAQKISFKEEFHYS